MNRATNSLRASLRSHTMSESQRYFSSSSLRLQDKLRIGYVPEHFTAPLHAAQTRFNLADHATLIPFPAGTGTMVEAFHRDNIDVGIGLTESWVAGMARDHARSPMASKKEWQRFHIASTYVESPLRWALSTGGKRTDINNIQDLRHKNVGVSRIGSGSHIMSMVLADQHRWFDPSGSPPFQIVICGPFAELRDAVTRSSADFFMWEHYTTKKFWDTGELKRIGEIPTPWNGWHIAVRGSTPDPRVQEILYPSLQKGLEWFKNEKEEVMEMLTGEMGYERPDAESWYQEVVYPGSFGSINQGGVGAAITSLRTAGFIQSEEVALSDFTAAES